MDLIYWAIIGIGIFVAVWMLFVVPAERRHHERKLEILQKRIEKRRAHTDQGKDEPAADENNENEES